ncbi:MAG: hypothetical protein HN383_15395 [Verrucomicrobia bacterium]|jgi:hypothetical protein|nr:hypothetical protein [Verrucomicrobiota bacterium]MBT7702446.1 hypothetical protein [Verrucomicrobiota bacterium]
MYKDEIISEVWRNRDAYARKHNYNLDEIVADLRKREQVHPDQIVDLGHRSKPCTPTK